MKRILATVLAGMLSGLLFGCDAPTAEDNAKLTAVHGLFAATAEGSPARSASTDASTASAAEVELAAELPSAMAVLGESTAQLVKQHQSFYLGKKSPEAASRMPAVVWHVGEGMTRGGDLTDVFMPARQLAFRRDGARLKSLAETVGEIEPRARALSEAADETSRIARALAARIATDPGGSRASLQWPRQAQGGVSEPETLYALALAALASQTPDYEQAGFYLKQMAGRLEHLADLGRWLAINCSWLVETDEWTREEGMAPRSLSYCIAARANEAAFIQSRIEDVLFTLDAERDLWLHLARARGGDASEVDIKESPPTAEAPIRERIAALREKALEADRQASELGHQRKHSEAIEVLMRRYLPPAAELDYLGREAALRRWRDRAGSDMGLAGLEAECLSLTARTALADVLAELGAKEARRLRPGLEEMLEGHYFSSYLDLCLYQAAVMGTQKDLALRISRWLALTPKPTARELMDILHATPGVMTTSQRANDAYQPAIMDWAGQCEGTRLERFEKARTLTNEFYRRHGYNANKPVNSVRDALENGLVDCIGASRIFASVAVAAGVAGLTPVRYWAQQSGHTIVGLRSGDKLAILDPLNLAAARQHPGAYPGVMTVEIGAPSFGGYVVCDVEIVSTGKRLGRDMPYAR